MLDTKEIEEATLLKQPITPAMVCSSRVVLVNFHRCYDAEAMHIMPNNFVSRAAKPYGLPVHKPRERIHQLH